VKWISGDLIAKVLNASVDRGCEIFQGLLASIYESNTESSPQGAGTDLKHAAWEEENSKGHKNKSENE
jgi:hypothetical protein